MLAFLFLTYDNVFNEKIWIEYFKNVDKSKYKIFVHAKNKNLICNQSFFKNFIMSKTHETQWGKFSLIEAQKLLLEEAYKSPEITHFILASHNCIPVTSFERLYTFLENKGSLIGYFLTNNNSHLIRYDRMKNPLFKKNQLLFQSQWCILSRDDVHILLTDHAIIRDIFGLSIIPDEHAYINYLTYYKNKTIEKNHTTHVAWNGSTPKIFDTLSNDFITSIKNGGKFFIRKVIDNINVDVNHLLS